MSRTESSFYPLCFQFLSCKCVRVSMLLPLSSSLSTDFYQKLVLKNSTELALPNLKGKKPSYIQLYLFNFERYNVNLCGQLLLVNGCHLLTRNTLTLLLPTIWYHCILELSQKHCNERYLVSVVDVKDKVLLDYFKMVSSPDFKVRFIQLLPFLFTLLSGWKVETMSLNCMKYVCLLAVS